MYLYEMLSKLPKPAAERLTPADFLPLSRRCVNFHCRPDLLYLPAEFRVRKFLAPYFPQSFSALQPCVRINQVGIFRRTIESDYFLQVYTRYIVPIRLQTFADFPLLLSWFGRQSITRRT